MKSVIIAAPVSGSGKTTVTIGIMAALKKSGLTVAPFKVGPDFIDPGYHRIVTERPSINLDSWMTPKSRVLESFARHGADAGIAVVEGVMGLFDGFGSGGEGSTAELARLTGSPVILVVNAKGFAASIAPLVKGFACFDPQVRIGGLILNNVSSESHRKILMDALSQALPDLPLVGAIMADTGLQLPSRHLGLTTVEDAPLSADFLGHLTEVIERSLNLDRLLSIAASQDLPPVSAVQRGEADTVIAVARDRAFCFVYEENLELLRVSGARIAEFSPLEDPDLPAGTDGIYLPGGYPELHGERLAHNAAMKKAIKAAVDSGMPVYAECGGLIYLTKGCHLNGRFMEFAGVFPCEARMLPKRKALGYREIRLTGDSILGAAGASARGHEFHYSEIGSMPPEVKRIYSVSRKGETLGEEGYSLLNCLASYIHLHFGSNPKMAEAFVARCRRHKAVKVL